jgi:manganese efflux pump family protein
MLGELLVLGFVLSLDNFRTAIALGALRLSRRHAFQVAVTFGFWDGVAPLTGILIGRYTGEAIGNTAEYIGAAALAAYGVYLLVEAWRSPATEEPERRWQLLGLTLPLSLDNVVAGTSLGLLGVGPWIAPVLFGSITTVMAFIGLQLGGAASRIIRIRPEVLTGVSLIIMATVLGPAL